MFKKLLSALTVMLFLCGMNAGAQTLQKSNMGFVMPKFAAKNVVTAPLDLQKDEFWTGYWDGEFNDYTSAIGVKETPLEYAAAICYPQGNGIIQGKTITGIKITFPDTKNIKDVKVFMSTKLPNTAEDADITCQSVTELYGFTDAEGVTEVRFDKPYKYDSSKPLYLGYFFRVSGGNGSSEKYPVAVQMGADFPNASYLKFSTGDWYDYYGQGFGVLAIQALMQGALEDNAAKIPSDLGLYIGAVKTSKLNLLVENTGKNSIKNFTIETDVDGIKTVSEIKPKKAVKHIGEFYSFETEVNCPETPGTYPFTITVKKVNGVDVTPSVSNGELALLTRNVEKKVVVEEFTGLWCGWCPLGMVGMQKIAQVYGDKVVRIAAHDGDPMACKDYTTVIHALATGFPMAAVDRTIIGVNPYYGKNQQVFGIKDDIEYMKKTVNPVAEVLAKPILDGDKLTAVANVTFLYTGDASKYGVAYVLTHDGMTHESWKQNNNLRGDKKYLSMDPLFEPFVNGKASVSGLIFDDVAIAAKGIEYGIEGSIPANVKAEETVGHSVEFDLSKLKKIQDKKNMNLVVILFNMENGTIENADVKNITDLSGIEGVEVDDENVKEVARYTVNGARINAAQKGINIVKYSDGTVKKVIVK